MVTRTFEFSGSRARRLTGRLEAPDGEVRGWALFAHCFTCGKEALAAVRVSRALAQAGIGVLRFDFAGIGGSEGDFEDTTFTSNIEDLVAAAAAMAAGGMPIDLMIGHSLGGAATIAAADELPDVRAFAVIATPFDVDHVLHQFGPMLETIRQGGEADVLLAGRTFRIGKNFVDDVETRRQADRIGHLKRPLLILHSPVDELVGVDHATRIFAAAKHPKSFISLDQADHLLNSKADGEYAGTVIAGWACRYLRTVVETRSAGQNGDVVVEETRVGRFQVTVHAGGTHFLADEPESVGGLGSGPTPYDLLSAGLAACTTMTLRLYLDRKGWSVERIRTSVGYMRDAGADLPDHFTRRIAIDGTLDPDQRARLIEIANKCPVHLTLNRGSRVTTELGEPPAMAGNVEMHAEVMNRTAGA